MTTNNACRAALLGAVLTLAFASCELGPVDDDRQPAPPPTCFDSLTHVNVGGTWTIKGEGTRWLCSDEAFDMDFELQSQPLSVRQDGLVLELDGPDPASPDGQANGAGSVDSACVEFTLSERHDNGEWITLHFSGWARSGRVDGAFNGSGPYGCSVAGSFVMDSGGSLGTGPPVKPLPEPEPEPVEPEPVEPPLIADTDPEEVANALPSSGPDDDDDSGASCFGSGSDGSASNFGVLILMAFGWNTIRRRRLGGP